MNDIVADSITRLRNAYMRRKDKTRLLYSKVVERSLSILKHKNFIYDYKIFERNNKKIISVLLRYRGIKRDKPAITEIKRLSKPGRRVYKGAKELKGFKNGYGIIVVSTNKGILHNRKAYELNVGGEVLFSVW